MRRWMFLLVPLAVFGSFFGYFIVHADDFPPTIKAPSYMCKDAGSLVGATEELARQFSSSGRFRVVLSRVVNENEKMYYYQTEIDIREVSTSEYGLFGDVSQTFDYKYRTPEESMCAAMSTVISNLNASPWYRDRKWGSDDGIYFPWEDQLRIDLPTAVRSHADVTRIAQTLEAYRDSRKDLDCSYPWRCDSLIIAREENGMYSLGIEARYVLAIHGVVGRGNTVREAYVRFLDANMRYWEKLFRQDKRRPPRWYDPPKTFGPLYKLYQDWSRA